MSTITAPTDRGYRDALQIWQCLSDGPWLGKAVALADDALLAEIHAVRFAGEDRPVYDMGFALLLRTALERGRFVRREPAENGWIRWVKASTAPAPDTRSYVEREQAALDAAAQRERDLLDEAAAFRRQLAEQEARFDPRRSEIVALLNSLNIIDRAGVQQLLADAIEPLRDEVAALRQELAAMTSELAALPSQTTEPRRFGRRGN